MSERYETDTGGGCLHSTVVENSLHQLRQIGCRKPQPQPQPQPPPSPQNSTYKNLHHSSHSTITTTESHIKSSKQLFDTNMMHGASEIYNFPSDGEIFCFPPRVLASHHTSEEASSSRVIGQGVLKNGGMSNSMWKPYANPQLQGKTPCYEGGQHNYTGPVYLGGDMFHQPSNNVVQPNPKHAVEIPMQASSLYENNAIPIVATELGNSQGNMWVNRTNELVLLPSYADHYLAPPYGVQNWPSNKNSHGHGALQDTYHPEPFVHEKVGNDFRPQHLSTNSGGHEGSGALSLSLTPHQPQHTIDAMQNRTSVFQISAEDVKSRSDDIVSKNGSEDGSYSRQAGQSFNGKTIDLLMNSGPLPPCTGYSSILKNSKYLKPAQQLLQEFCNLGGKGQTCSYNVSKEVGGSSEQLCFDKSSQDNHAVANSSVNVKDEESTVNACSASSSMVMVSRMPNEDSDQQQYSCDRYEMQKMQSKLASLLEELNKRYRLYHQTMQMIMSSFESVSGLGAAVPYTTLALKRMSKHFRCLRNSISNQLKSIAKTLGDDSSLAELYRGNTSKTSFVNHSLRTQRPLHPLGLIEQHPWRPQRGLPERSVAVLRAWLFEHFLYPYPTDAEKHMLARQTGLTRSQVSNWFINARVRLWKPMVEEMWMLEQKEIADMDSKEGKWKGIDNRDIMKSPPMGKHIAKHGKAILEGFPELHSIGGSSKVNHGVSGSKDSSENIDTRMNTHVVGTHFLQGQEMDRSTDSDVNSSRNFCQEQYQFPYPINGSVGISRRYDEMNGFLAYGQSPKRLRQQGFESTIDLSSYMTGKYTPESLATARQVGNTNVSLTLGLQHGSGPEKYSSAIFLPGDGDSLQGCTQQFQIHGVNEAHDQNFGGSFNPQDLQFRKNLVGSQLLH